MYFTESFSTFLSLCFPQLHPNVLLKVLECRKPFINVYWIELDHLVKPFILHKRTVIFSRLSTQCHPDSVRAETQVQVFWLHNPLKYHTLSDYLGCEQRWDLVSERCCVILFQVFIYILFSWTFFMSVLFFFFNKRNSCGWEGTYSFLDYEREP